VVKKEIEITKKNFDILTQLLGNAKNKLHVDSVFYQSGHISKREITNNYNTYLEKYKNYLSAENEMNSFLSKRKREQIQYVKEKNRLLQDINSVNIELTNEKKKKQSITKLLNKSNELNTLQHNELQKRYIISEDDCVVDYLYTLENNTNIVKKGEVLARLTPLKNKYYTKLIIAEKDVWRIRINQEVLLKISAFHYVKHGIIKGKISYVPNSYQNNEQIHIRAKIVDYLEFNLKPGYTLQGDIVIEKMRLWEYLMIKILKSN
jgi:hypothetical protein